MRKTGLYVWRAIRGWEELQEEHPNIRKAGGGIVESHASLASISKGYQVATYNYWPSTK
jgi:hypothetical protein